MHYPSGRAEGPFNMNACGRAEWRPFSRGHKATASAYRISGLSQLISERK